MMPDLGPKKAGDPGSDFPGHVIGGPAAPHTFQDQEILRLRARIAELERHAELALIACKAGDPDATKQALTDALNG